jgi:hypothetical protein
MEISILQFFEDIQLVSWKASLIQMVAMIILSLLARWDTRTKRPNFEGQYDYTYYVEYSHIAILVIFSAIPFFGLVATALMLLFLFSRVVFAIFNEYI